MAAAHVFLAVGHGVLLAFDDGFSGGASSWVLHIPLMASTFGLFEGKDKSWRLFWVLMTLLSLTLVNTTDWCPHLNFVTAAGQEPIVALSNLVLALVAAWLVQQFLEGRYLSQLAERDKLESQLQAALDKETGDSQAKSKLISHVSHEFRTPLNAISGFAQLLRSGSLSPSELAENLEAIHRSADHLVHLVNNMLDMSRMEQGELQLARVAFDPEFKVRDCVALLQPLAREKGIFIDEIIEGTPGLVEGDPIRLTQILLNLAGNAVKFTAKGTVTLLLRQQPTTAGQCILHIEVSDTGPGIPPERHEFIFERFARLQEHGSVGTGLGLAICRDLINRMAGTIRLESELGKGTTFFLELPMNLANVALAPQDDESSIHLPVEGKRILLCDDNRLNLRLASQVLKRMEIDFDAAESGEEALVYLRECPYDLIMLDLHMPGIDGFEVARILRAEAGPNRQTPILALTADASESTRTRCLEIGMSGFAAKPIHLGQLEMQLRRMLDGAAT